MLSGADTDCWEGCSWVLLCLGFLITVNFLGEFAKLRMAIVSFVMSVRPSAWNNSAPTGRILMKFDI